MTRKILSIIAVFVLSLNLCFNAAAAICTGGEGCPHYSSIHTIKFDPTKGHHNRQSGCCDNKRPITCEASDRIPLLHFLPVNAGGMETRFDSLLDSGIIVGRDIFHSSANGANLEALLPPLIPSIPIYLQHLSLII
ncbi:MAG: hypothetical protein QF876_13620 [Desulfobacterales bacterium]|jgi:hypothetical protein|nr:hypothetical protein [Desulfobacter sp.]MDP6683993.1 hypothetical protein [Desulfobacterales bacterium]MDP6808990.1 hypothetical protein [Desulfobacterales bacterium]|tara:strand:- start:4328 stop:4735 length:408 start_codon:yes stop_codon:yes gene_type:complete